MTSDLCSVQPNLIGAACFFSFTGLACVLGGGNGPRSEWIRRTPELKSVRGEGREKKKLSGNCKALAPHPFFLSSLVSAELQGVKIANVASMMSLALRNRRYENIQDVKDKVGNIICICVLNRAEEGYLEYNQMTQKKKRLSQPASQAAGSTWGTYNNSIQHTTLEYCPSPPWRP